MKFDSHMAYYWKLYVRGYPNNLSLIFVGRRWNLRREINGRVWKRGLKGVKKG